MDLSSFDSLQNLIETVRTFQEEIYGDIENSERNFPFSLQEHEAGPSQVKSGDGSHSIRRYLWTDSFGIMNYVSLAQGYTQLGDHDNCKKFFDSAYALIQSVFAVLGTPSSGEYPMANSLSGGFKGLRIGKLKSCKGHSDAGMEFDGMYFHYIDKFLFALCR